MNKEKEQLQKDNELIKTYFSIYFEEFYDKNFDKVFDEVYEEQKKKMDKNGYKKFKDEIGYNALNLKFSESIKQNVWGLLKGTMETFHKSGILLIVHMD